MHNSWDKNDPKDAQVILHMLKTGLTQTWHDPLLSGTNDAQELSKTHHQITLARTRVWHSLRPVFTPVGGNHLAATVGLLSRSGRELPLPLNRVSAAAQAAVKGGARRRT